MGRPCSKRKMDYLSFAAETSTVKAASGGSDSADTDSAPNFPNAPWSETFMRAYPDALNGTKAQASNIAAAHTVAGTVNALVVAYLDPQSSSTQSGRSMSMR